MTTLTFNDQRNFQPTDMQQVEYAATDLSNPKEFFIRQDGISNSGYETFISVFQRYRCEAGCEVCYIKDRWVRPDGTDYFGEFATPEMDPDHEDRILDAFSYFTTVSTIDDLFFIKHKYPGLFEFYKRNSHIMNLTSMTDMAVLQQTDLACNDLNFKSVYDITFSDYFLAKSKVTDAVIKKLDQLNERYPMVKIRFIVSGDPLLDRTGIKRVIKWAKDHGIYTMGSLDNRIAWNFTNEIMNMMDHQGSAYVTDDEHELHQVYSEVSHMMYDRWVVSFYESTQDNDLSFYQMKDRFIPDEWLESHVRHKLKLYADSAKRVPRNDNTEKYVDYFNYVTDHVHVNDNWNFIPYFMLNKRSDAMHQGLLRNGFVTVPYGIMRQTAVASNAAPIPLYTFK